MPKIVFLWTDVILWLLAAGFMAYAWQVRRRPGLAANWAKVFRDPAALAASVLVLGFALVAALDSVHFRRALPAASGDKVFYATRTESLLDVLLARQADMRETTYSRPLAYLAFNKQAKEVDGKVVRDYPRLLHGGAHLKNPEQEWAGDVAGRAFTGFAGGLVAALLATLACGVVLARKHGETLSQSLQSIAGNRTELPLRAGLATLAVVTCLSGMVVALMDHYHVFGTDLTGNDVLLQALKSVRTAFVIGLIATVATVPLALTLGVLAGYFRGWVDEVIQYVYTTLSSVPNVLLIAACVLMMQVFIDQHPELFETGVERADLRIFTLCLILGLTGWANLCRLVRGETLKLRELEFVQAATAFGVSDARIMARHIVPNVMHLVLITTVLEFSSLVLYEAVLSFVGVGVDPSQNSFGGMINLARNEMSRDPVVWWSFAAAFGFMVTLVLAANLFADGVRDAFDPRARVFRRRLIARAPALAK